MSAAYASVNSYESGENEESLEAQLKHSLRRVEPNPEFVGHLHTRLTTPAMTTIERRQSAAFGLFLVAFTLMSGVFFVWLLRQFRAA